MHGTRWGGRAADVVTLALLERLNQAFLPLLLLLETLLIEFAGQMGQLLHREQHADPTDEGLQAVLQLAALLLGQRPIALGVHLGDQVKTSLPHGPQEPIPQHLEVEGQVAVKLGMPRSKLAV
jgi:hypothetical protein